MPTPQAIVEMQTVSLDEARDHLESLGFETGTIEVQYGQILTARRNGGEQKNVGVVDLWCKVRIKTVNKFIVDNMPRPAVWDFTPRSNA